MAAKEVTCQVRYMTDNANTINKNYTGLKSTITNDQIKALAQFFNQLTDDEVIVAYKITKDEIKRWMTLADLKIVIAHTDTTTRTITIPDAKTGISRATNFTPYYDVLNAAFSDFATIKSAYYENIQRTQIDWEILSEKK